MSAGMRGITVLRMKAFMLAAASILCCGCGRNSDAVPENTALDSSTGGTDKRIVCGSPAVAEIVFALGCGDRVVGVSDYTVYPPEAKEKQSIGGWINPNRERLLMMEPDIIISQGKHETLASFCDEYGILFHAVKLDCLEDIYSAVQSIAENLCVTDRGKKLNARVRSEIAAVRARTAGFPSKRVFLLMGRSPGSLARLSTVGPDTFLDEMIRMGGGTNIFADAKGLYPRISKESLLVRRPEVILEIYPGEIDGETIDLLMADWNELADLPAVRNNRIHCLTNNFLMIPGPRAGLIARKLARTITPEAYSE